VLARVGGCLIIELLARTCMRADELSDLEADAVIRIGQADCLRISLLGTATIPTSNCPSTARSLLANRVSVARANSLPVPRALPRRAVIVTARDLASLISSSPQWWKGVGAAGLRLARRAGLRGRRPGDLAPAAARRGVHVACAGELVGLPVLRRTGPASVSSAASVRYGFRQADGRARSDQASPGR
jgi:hypothetical protein